MTREETKNKVIELNTKPYDFDAFLGFIKEIMPNPTEEEILGFVDANSILAPKLHPKIDLSKAIDISGTGGDKVNTINVGTITGLVLATGGLYVAKASTRGHTSPSGSSDLLNHLGIKVNLDIEEPARIERMIKDSHFGAFYYPALTDKYANQKRFFGEMKERGIRIVTPNHIASWLLNLVGVKNRIYGMFTDKYLELAMNVLRAQGVENAWVLNGTDGLDEISNIGETKVVELKNDNIKSFIITPKDFGIKAVQVKDISITDAEESFKIAENIIAGKEDSPHNDLVLMNSSAGFYLSGLADSLKDGVELAKELLASGKVQNKVDEIRAQF